MGAETRNILMPMCEKQVTTEVSGDFSLPDYQPEIRRILHVSYTILPPAKYVSGGGVEFNGSIEYQILYVGADGGLYTAPLTSEYSLNVPFDGGNFDLGEGVTVWINTTMGSIYPRLSAPRKLSIRCRLTSRVCAYGKMPLEESLSGCESPFGIQRKIDVAPMACLWGTTSDMISLSDELATIGDDGRVISAESCVLIGDVGIGENAVSVQGELLLKLLCTHEGKEEIETILRKLPFTGEIESEEWFGDATRARVRGHVSDLSVHVEEGGKLLCDANLILEAQIGANTEISYSSDLYSTTEKCRTELGEYQLPVLAGIIRGNFSQSERIGTADLNLPAGCTLVDAIAGVTFDSCENVGGKVVLGGQSRYVLICVKDGEYSASECLLPVRFETDGGGMTVDSADTSALVISCRARIDGDVLSLDSEIAVTSTLMGHQKICPVVSASFGEKIPHSKGDMILCYPSKDDSAWTVAKRYCVPTSSVVGNAEEDLYVVIQE